MISDTPADGGQHPLRVAGESNDWPSITALLHPDVHFRSPAVFKPYRGRAACLHLFADRMDGSCG